MIIASVSHSQFKLMWLQSEVAKMNGKALLLEMMQALSSAATSGEGVAALSTNYDDDDDDDDDDGFFCFCETDEANNSVSAELPTSKAVTAVLRALRSSSRTAVRHDVACRSYLAR